MIQLGGRRKWVRKERAGTASPSTGEWGFLPSRNGDLEVAMDLEVLQEGRRWAFERPWSCERTNSGCEHLDFPQPFPFTYRTLGSLVCAAELCDWGEPCKRPTGVMKCRSSEPHLWSHDLISLCACTVIPSLITESHRPSPGNLSHPVCGMDLFWGEVTAVQ